MPTKERTEQRNAAMVSAAASAMSMSRWKKIGPEERREIATWVASHGAGRPRTNAARCPCGAMTLTLAKQRGGVAGTSLGHRKGCPFWRAHKLKVRGEHAEN